MTVTFVQSGTSVTGILRNIVRSVSTSGCQPLVGFSFVEPFSGTVTGQFPNGAGTFSVVTPSGSGASGNYANGRMTGTSRDGGGDPGTFVLTRQ